MQQQQRRRWSHSVVVVAAAAVYAVLLRSTAYASGGPRGSSCATPLGMEHGHIKDEAITASSSFDFKSVGPHNARINTDRFGGAWCPKTAIGPKVREWIEIDLGGKFRLTQTGTQGRYGQGKGQEYAEKFHLEYFRDGEWRTYKNHTKHQELEGNRNTYVEKRNILDPPIVASRVRFVPQSEHPRTVCMRVEIYGCRYTREVDGYRAPSGDEFSPHVFLEDIFDGQEDSKFGLGVLSDGLDGGTIDFAKEGISKAHGWVGWKNRNFPVEIDFRFSTPKRIRAVSFITFRQNDFGIKPFSAMVLRYFSTDPREKNDGGNFYSTKVDTAIFASVNNGPQNMTLEIVGKKRKPKPTRFVKVELHFEEKWILLSEIRFHFEDVDSIRDLDEDESGDSDETVEPPVFASTPSAISTMTPSEENDDDGEEEDGDNKDQATDESDEEGDSSAMSDTPGPVKEQPSSEQRLKEGKESGDRDNSQIYVGLVIGALGVTVLLLVATIVVMVRKNSQKIFNKQSLFKSPLSEHRHMMREMTNSTKLYEEASTPLAGCPTDSFLHRHSQIYQEPNDAANTVDGGYRFILRCPPSNLNPAYRQRNSSCGRLCDYDVPLMLDNPQEPAFVSSAASNVAASTAARLPSAKNKFGSTPMFNNLSQVRTAAATTTNNRPQKTHVTVNSQGNPNPGASYILPASFSCHEVKSGYSTPSNGDQSAFIIPHSISVNNGGHRLRLYESPHVPPPPPEPFYAATDIFMGHGDRERQEEVDGEDRGQDQEGTNNVNATHII